MAHSKLSNRMGLRPPVSSLISTILSTTPSPISASLLMTYAGPKMNPLRPVQQLPPSRKRPGSNPIPPKPKRRGAVCNHCRERKTLCDRKRPSCQRCIGLGVECTYVSDNPAQTLRSATHDEVIRTLQKRLREHEDILEELRRRPPDEVVAVVRRLGSTKNPAGVLSTLKGSAHAAYRPSQHATERGSLPSMSTAIEFELCKLHPAVYPPLLPLDLSIINLGKQLETHAGDAQPAYSFEVTLSNLLLPEGSHSNQDIQIDSPAALRGTTARRHSPRIGPAMSRQYCDPRLEGLKMDYWTLIPVDDEFAACALSLHFETYHAFFGFVDVDLFIGDLVEHKLDYCSAFLVSAIMSTACQDYSTFDNRSAALSTAFFHEAKGLWKTERNRDGATTLAALSYFSISCFWSGRDEVGMQVIDDVRNMPPRMKLFDVRPTQELVTSFLEMSPNDIKALAHVAWGCYGFLILYSAWYPLAPIEHPPVLPIPGDPDRAVQVTDPRLTWPPHPVPAFVGTTFLSLRRFYVIVQEIHSAYGPSHESPPAKRLPLAFAESKYQLLLRWADSLDPDMHCGEHSASHVFVFHAIINLFLPFLEDHKLRRLHSFNSDDSNPGAVFAASLAQLKYLLYRLHIHHPNHKSTNQFLSGPLLHILPALITNADPDSSFVTQLVYRFWRDLYIRYRVVRPMLQSQLTIALENDILTTNEALDMMRAVETNDDNHSASEVAAKCLINLKRVTGAHEVGDEAIEVIAKRFEELMVIERFTQDVV